MRQGWLRQGWILCGLLVLSVGCSDEAEPYLKASRAQQAAIEEVSDILAGITDGASMDAARDKLIERYDHCELVAHRSKNLPKPSSEVMERLAGEKDKMSAAVQKLQAEVKRVRGLPDGAKFLQDVKIQK
jgi:hypothetical protein